jgi:hypothetical protein
MASFKQDVSDGQSALKSGLSDMTSATRASSREAQGSLALIGDEIGVTIPRHLRTFIAAMPGVGTALNAAFDSVAVLALISLIVTIVQHIGELQKQAEAAAEAMTAFGNIGNDAAHKMDEEILALNQHIAELQGNTILALKLALEGVNEQKFDTLTSEMAKIGTEATKLFAQQKVTWFQNLLGSGNNDAVQDISNQVTAVIAQIQKLSKAGDDAGISGVIQAQLDKVKGDLATFDSWGKGETQVKNALEGELSTLTALQTMYDHVETIAAKRDGVDVLEASQKAAKELNAELQKMRDSVSVDAVTAEITGGISAQIAMMLQFVTQWKDVTSQITAGTPGGPSPSQGFSKEALDQIRLQGDLNEQYLRAQQLFTDTRTDAEKYANEMQVLNTLLASGAISQDTYNRSVTQAKEKYDDVSKGLAQIGDTVGRDISQAALYGGSWVKAFQDIAAEIVKVVIQMTLLKSLQQASAASGGGGLLGFFTSIVGGLSGKAVGGPVYQGEGYMVGENGPEFFSPTTSGTIVPNPVIGGGGPQTVNHNEQFIFNGVADMDSFRKSQSQVAAAMAAQLSRHAGRNG